jgi:hypothetical protein
MEPMGGRRFVRKVWLIVLALTVLVSACSDSSPSSSSRTHLNSATTQPEATTTTQSAAQRALGPALAWCQANNSTVTGFSPPTSTDVIGDCVKAYSAVGPAASAPNTALVAALTFPLNAADLDGSPAGVGTGGLAMCTDPVNSDALRAAAAAVPMDADALRMIAGISHTTLAEYVCLRANLGSGLVNSTPPVNSPSMTLDEFNRIATGMSHDEVTGIVGSPGTLSAQSSVGGFTDEIYSWQGSGSGNANVTFQNGSVVGKAQVGLS